MVIIQYILMAIFAFIIIVADQITKYLVVLRIPINTDVDAVPGLFHLTYVKNTGAAFSLMQGQRWFLILIVAILVTLVIWEFSRKYFPFTNFERWCITAIIAGGVSNNLIDRFLFGYVVDMIELEFVRFAVFNIADCFVVCGCILFMTHLVFFNDKFWHNIISEKK